MKIAISQRKILGKNGSSRIILHQADLFKKMGHDVSVYCSRYNKDLLSPFKVKQFFSFHPSRERRRFKFAEDFGTYCKQEGVTLAIGNGDTYFQNVLFMHNLVDYEHKIIYGNDDYESSRVFRIHKKILEEKSFDLMICNSKLMLDYFSDKYNIPVSLMEIAYPGFDPNIFNLKNKSECRKIFKSKYAIDRDFIIGFITSGNMKKRGIDFVVNGLKNISSEISKNSVIFLMAKDEMLHHYAEEIKNINKDIIVITSPPVSEIAPIYKSLDLLLHPAHIEEFGMTQLEASACGIPVITSKMSGVAEIFSKNSSPYIMNRPNSEELTYIIETLYSDTITREKFAAENANCTANYTWETYFNKILSLYKTRGLI